MNHNRMQVLINLLVVFKLFKVKELELDEYLFLNIAYKKNLIKNIFNYAN